MEEPVLYIHPTCATSYEAVKHLAARGLLDRVRLVDASEPGPAGVLRGQVWSVPWLLLPGGPAATDPVTGEELEALLLGGEVPDRDLGEAFAEAVLHSAYAAAVAYLHGGFGPVLDPALVSAAVRAPARGLDPGKLVEWLRPLLPGLWQRWEDAVMRALGISFVRELWWATRGGIDRDGVREAASPSLVGAWLIAKASLGRAGLPARPLPEPERLERLAGFVRRGAAGLLSRVRREQETILGDEKYWEVLRSALGMGRR